MRNKAMMAGVIALLMTAGARTACSGPASDPTGTTAPAAGGDLIIGRDGEGTTLDSTNTNFENYSIAIFQQIGESLYATTKDGQTLEPLLAAEMPEISADELTYTVKLRDDVTFSDGTPMTADDVKFSIDADTAGAGEGGWGFINSAIDTVTVVDEHTVEFHLKHPWAPFVADLSIFSNAIVPANYGGKSKDEFYEAPIGTGPFMFKEWVRGDHATVVKNPNYWQDGKPSLDSITWRVMPDSNTRKLALKSGQIHAEQITDWSSWQEMSSTPGLTATAFPSTEIDYISMNVDRPPLNDPHVRVAIAHAIDREAIIEAVLFGNGEQANSVIPKGVPFHNPDNEGPTFDLEKAKAEMAASSVPEGFSTTMLINSGDATHAAIAQILQDELKPLGIALKIDQQEATARKEREFATDYDMTIALWTMDIPDPDEWTTAALDPNGGLKSSYTNYDNPAIVELNSQAQSTNDTAARKELYDRIQAEVPADSSLALLYYVPFGWVHSDAMQGFSVTPLGYVGLKDVTLAAQ
ncbi:ABC transporter substrate-binding protein [Microbacterium profundi]|uniref:ABC transporter substrate-binding protein n=1 Tax=Microbacterium profundi TaxID=450380 RepID=UPI001F2D5168|nr:ABC transporter substrate-binding protein [Microbacterium profundi]MCE7482016.1 ABC transporter substrate-binding protein [Microbacterium profundi]